MSKPFARRHLGKALIAGPSLIAAALRPPDAVAQGPGVVHLGPGSHGTMILGDSVQLVGEGPGATSVQSITTADFWSLWDGNAPEGPTNAGVRDLRVAGSSGHGVNLYAPGPLIERVILNNHTGHGMFSRWSNDLGALSPPDMMEGRYVGIKAHDNGGAGVWFDGPHDTQGEGWIAFLNATHGIVVMPNGGGLQLVNGHAWGNGGWAFYVNAAGVQLANCVGESEAAGCFALLQDDIVLTGARAFSTVGAAATGLHIAGDGVKVLNAVITNCRRPVVFDGADGATVTGTIRHPFDLAQYPVFQGAGAGARGELFDVDRKIVHRWPTS